MQPTTLQEIKAYLHRIKKYFVTWEIRLLAESWIIKITYKSAFINFVVKEEVPEADRKAFHTIVDFCFDAFFDYERQNQPLTSEDLGCLLNLTSVYIREILSNIYQKIREDGIQLLQEEQEIRVVHHRRQKPARSLIQKKQSTGDTGKEKKRVERPLWEN